MTRVLNEVPKVVWQAGGGEVSLGWTKDGGSKLAKLRDGRGTGLGDSVEGRGDVGPVAHDEVKRGLAQGLGVEATRDLVEPRCVRDLERFRQRLAAQRPGWHTNSDNCQRGCGLLLGGEGCVLEAGELEQISRHQQLRQILRQLVDLVLHVGRH